MLFEQNIASNVTRNEESKYNNKLNTQKPHKAPHKTPRNHMNHTELSESLLGKYGTFLNLNHAKAHIP